MNRRRQAAEEHSARVAEKRSNAVNQAIAGATTVDEAQINLAELAKTNEFRAYNVNSPNNCIRLIDKWYGYKGVNA